MKQPRWAVLTAVLCGLAAAAAEPPPFPDRAERVLGLGRAWAKVKFIHPWLASREVDWDAAFLAALPRAEAAATPAEYRAAVAGLLDALRDPVTAVLEPLAEPGPTPAWDGGWLTSPAPGVVRAWLAPVVAPPWDYVRTRERGRELVQALARARVLVLDLQGADVDGASELVDELVPLLPPVKAWPLERTVERHGFRTQEGTTSGGYFTAFSIAGARPSTPGRDGGLAAAVFVLDARSALPPVALALQASGRAALASVGALPEAAAVTTTTVELPAGLSVRVRVGELLGGPPHAEVVADTPAALEARLGPLLGALADGGALPRPAAAAAALPALRDEDDDDYPASTYPSRELRVLAGVRLWAVLDTLFPYRPLIDDWDGALRRALPELEAAADAQAYRLALTHLAVAAGDGHVGLWPPWNDPATPRRAATPVATRLVEGKLAVVRALEPPDGGAPGLRVGEVVETIDGQPAAVALARELERTSGSTEEARRQRAAAQVLHGDLGSAVALGVRGADGRLREVRLERATDPGRFHRPPPGAHFKVLPGNVGYADLTALRVPEVGPMFEAFKDTRALVLDMRGYPNGTAWAIAPRLNVRRATVGAQFSMPLLTLGAEGGRLQTRQTFLQPLPPLPPGASLYARPVVVLIDDRAISQAEHSCLFFEAAAAATFVGSPTHGANGDVTVLRLPGGLRLSFTGQEVRHADGRQLQRVGIQPQVTVRPTLAGLRAGRDEVLERALAHLAGKR